MQRTDPASDALAVARLAALGQATRLDVVRALARAYPAAVPAGDIARLVGATPATLSTHLGLLEDAGLVRSHRDGRRILYAVDPDALNDLRAALPKIAPDHVAAAPVRSLSVLFVCTGNSARSIIAEALLARYGKGRFVAASAGARPSGAVDPEALALLARLGFDTRGLSSKAWLAWSGPEAPAVDLVITLCDEAAGEACPPILGAPLVTHWGVADPVRVPAERRRSAMRDAYRQLAARITALMALPVETLDRQALAAELARIARLDGATPLALVRAAS